VRKVAMMAVVVVGREMVVEEVVVERVKVR
jgi:hypothetical protein